MTIIITATNGSGSTSPYDLTTYEVGRDSRNVIRDTIGGGIGVTLVPARPRAGTHELLYADEAPARAALDLHAQATRFTLVDSDSPASNMTYVTAGRMRLVFRADRIAWVLSIGYQEVQL